MLPSRHFIATLILSIILFPYFRWLSLLAFIGGFLVDVDHYLMYIIKFKDFSIKKTYEYCNKGPKHVLMIFHTAEVWIILFILSFVSKAALIIFIGLMLHMIMDLIYNYRKKRIKNRVYSIVFWLIKKFS